MKTLLVVAAWFVVTGVGAQNGKPAAQISITDVSCSGQTDGRINLTLQSGALPVAVVWTNMYTGATGTGQIAQLGQPFVLNWLAPGPYTIRLTGANGADSVLTCTVGNPLPLNGNLFILTNFGGFPVFCTYGNNGVAVYEPTGGTPPFSIAWSNGDVDVRADSLSAGPLSVTITDSRGCSKTVDTILVVPQPLAVQIQATGETCLGQNSGRIQLASTTGGIPPYLFSLNGGTASPQTNWTDLSPGIYFLEMEDAAGCIHTEAVLLPSGLEFTLEVGADTTILSGDTLLRVVSVSPPADTLIWKPAYGVQKLSATDYLLSPRYGTTYEVTAINTDGCMATDALRVDVDRYREVYVPNVFSPHAQLVENQLLTVYGDAGIRTVSQFSVYDRFGRRWFQKQNFPVNDPATGWDGTHDTDQAPAGVYLWRAVLLLNDGRELLLQGDVTLLR
ncbi:MAG: hypothetical protein ABMA02_11665 [Saprospiraceae bacterium]